MERSKQYQKRNAILACLRASRSHPSAEAVYAKLKADYPDISLGTVYRNLALFKRQGKIASVGTVDGIERFDGNVAPHAHFICTRCGRVQDLPGLEVPEALCQSAARRVGGRIEKNRLSFLGVCRDCLKTMEEGGEPG